MKFKKSHLLVLTMSAMFILPGVTTQVSAVGNMYVTVNNVPANVDVGATRTIYATSSPTADSLKIYIDGVEKASCTNCYILYYSWTPKLGEYMVKAQGIKYSPFGFDNAVKWTKADFGSYGSSYSTWRTRSNDVARGSGHYDYLFDTAVEILSEYDDEITSVVQAIDAFDDFGGQYLVNQYFSVHPDGREYYQGVVDNDNIITDAMTAYEVAQDSRFQSFDGSTETDRAYDCVDMAAFLSGMAHSIGLISRMVAATIDYEYQAGQTTIADTYFHIFTEIQGKDEPSGYPDNNGWWVIDPGHTNNYISSASTANEFKSAIYIEGGDDTIQRFNIIGEIDVWGIDYSLPTPHSGLPSSIQIYWQGYGTPEYHPYYTGNPWGL